MKVFAFFLIIFEAFILTKSINVTPSNFKEILSNAKPGDILELSAGTYNNAPYIISTNGELGKPITIRPVSGSKVLFKGAANENCIFELDTISYINIEGNMEISNAFCGIKAIDCASLLIKGLYIHDINEQAIEVSGDNIEIFNNTIYSSSLNSKVLANNLIFGKAQCTNVVGKKNNKNSKNIILKKNNIYNSYGEGISLLNCESCSVIGNNIQNTLSMNIFVNISEHILIDGNIIKITNNDYNSKFGKAVGIGLSSNNTNSVKNITIQNNLIVGCRIGIYYFPNGIGLYDLIKIYHNTIWMIDITPIWFTNSLNTIKNNELYNNFLYNNIKSQFSPKSVWNIGYNVFYNTDVIPDPFEDTTKITSKAVKKIDLSKIFNNQNGDCNYEKLDININCFRPSDSSETNIKLLQAGTELSTVTDIEGCNRDKKKPSIGAFEFTEGCMEETDTSDSFDTTDYLDTTDLFDTTDYYITDAPETEAPITDEPEIHYDLQFRIEYKTKYGQELRIVGSFCNWNVNNGYVMQWTNGHIWVYTLKQATVKNFLYKFVVLNADKTTKWESDPNRTFDGPLFETNIKNKKYSGTINSCNYVYQNGIISLTCSWR